LQFDVPIIACREALGGSGNAVSLELRHERNGTHGDEHIAADMDMAKQVGECLHKHYRGHFWAVHVDSKQGVCLISIPVLLGNWKYLIKLRDLTPLAVFNAGGEILERFNIPRSALDVAAFCEARKLAVSTINQTPPGGVAKPATRPKRQVPVLPYVGFVDSPPTQPELQGGIRAYTAA
jgi:hypothetical protein